MEKALWYLFVGMRGGENRARIVEVIDEQPRNANQIADCLDVDYNTVRMLYAGAPSAQQAVAALRILQTVALVFLTYVTLK